MRKRGHREDRKVDKPVIHAQATWQVLSPLSSAHSPNCRESVSCQNSRIKVQKKPSAEVLSPPLLQNVDGIGDTLTTNMDFPHHHEPRWPNQMRLRVHALAQGLPHHSDDHLTWNLCRSHFVLPTVSLLLVIGLKRSCPWSKTKTPLV